MFCVYKFIQRFLDKFDIDKNELAPQYQLKLLDEQIDEPPISTGCFAFTHRYFCEAARPALSHSPQ